MKNEEMKTNEKELILETPIGPISVDLGQFAAIQEQIEQEARDQLNNNNNVKNYKMWVTQQSMQDKYSQMERARMIQMQAEAQM